MSKISEAIATTTLTAAYLAMSVVGTGLWIYAIWHDAKHDKIGYMIGDIILPPIGFLRGLLLWLGVL